MLCKLTARVHVVVAILFGLLAADAATAAEPADPDLIPEARRVLEYLEALQGKQMLSGISGSQDAQPWAVLHMTGREPAIAGGDMAGFHRKWEKQYHQVMQNTVDKCIHWWRDKGGIVALQYHWMKPGEPEGSAWIGPPRGTGRLDLQVFRFEPITARYVRLHYTSRAVTWQAYTVYELGVYESIPE